jgi:hypothetical protein
MRDWCLLTLILVTIQFNGLYAQGKKTNGFRSGVNGHPLNQKAYLDVPIDEQLLLLKSINCNYYRIDVSTYADGTILNKFRFTELASRARVRNIKVVPMLYLTGFTFSLSEDDAYAKGLQLGTGFGAKYGAYCEFYELGNEMDVRTELVRNSGSDYADYLVPQMRVLASYLKGLNTGLKKSDPGAKTIVNCGGWFHFVYLELLQKLGVDYDIAGYHWYSYMDDYAKTVNVDILKVLPSRLKKDIWFTEINYDAGKNITGDLETLRKAWVLDFISKCKKATGIKAAFVYELLDEPNLPGVALSERTFGLFTRKNSTGNRLIAKALGASLSAGK